MKPVTAIATLCLACFHTTAGMAESLDETVSFIIFGQKLSNYQKSWKGEYVSSKEKFDGQYCQVSERTWSVQDNCHFDVVDRDYLYKSSCTEKSNVEFRNLFEYKYDMSHISYHGFYKDSNIVEVKSNSPYLMLRTTMEDSKRGNSSQDWFPKYRPQTDGVTYIWYALDSDHEDSDSFQKRMLSALTYYREKFCNGDHF